MLESYHAALPPESLGFLPPTISEEAADWLKVMITQRIIRTSIVRASEQLDPRCSQQTYIPPSQSTTQGLHLIARISYTTHCTYPRRDGQAELTWVAENIPRCHGLPARGRSPIQILARQCRAGSGTGNLLITSPMPSPATMPHDSLRKLDTKMYIVLCIVLQQATLIQVSCHS